ncbi:DUF3592 domain-containing protein [Flavobacterium sp. D11R37]|uniref:DUF3592 domain-containing protein n=1 Tax=Flavobacterium coralii TaxID=2838017 RepID=UPI001CA7306E|nr:DUF3592 domain-containing protein [Flavobacterium coralii]MBY8963025.1 DUF3592 domain-containing protein [Flavobacterium coralii]
MDDITPYIFVGAGIVLLSFAYRQRIKISLLKNAAKAEAVVIDNIEKYHQHGKSGYTKLYYPVVKYNSGSNEVICQLPYGFSPEKSAGTILTIYYNPEKPSEVYDDSAAGFKALPIILMLSGGTMLILGLLYFVGCFLW